MLTCNYKKAVNHFWLKWNMSQLLGILFIFVQLTVSNFTVGGESYGLAPTDESVHIINNSPENYTANLDSSEENEFSSGRNAESANGLQNNTASSDVVFSTRNISSPCHDGTENVTGSPLCQSNGVYKKINNTFFDVPFELPSSSLRQCPTSSSDACETFSLDSNIYCDFTCEKCLPKAELCDIELRFGILAENEACVHSVLNENVLMVTSCRRGYKNEYIRGYCETLQTNLRYDLWLMTPVTDFETNTTYKNVFCAACNDQPLGTIHFWDLLLVCNETESTELPKLFRNIDQNDGIISRLHPRKTGFWKYKYRNPHKKDFCFFHPKVDDEISGSVQVCKSKSAIKARRNHFDVEQNVNEPNFNNESKSLGEKYSSESPNSSFIKPEPLQSDFFQQSIILNLNDKSIQTPRFSGCDDERLFQTKSLHDILCTGLDGKAKCKLKLVDCVTAKYYSGKPAPINFADYEKYSINDTHTFVCGPEVTDSIHGSKVLAPLMTVLLFLLRSAFTGLIFHLLIFAWLPAKSTLDKNLGCFGFTLLVQNLCAIYDRQRGFISCRIVASIWHYSMLSSFTWVLILSYDCWLNLRQIFQLYDLIDEYDSLQFLIYFAVSQIIPLLVTSAGLTFGSSPADCYCQRDLGLDRYECLLSEVPGFTPFFIISALFLFALNIYFLVRVGCLVFSRELYLKEVRQKFNDRSGFALMMSPTWMLGSLLILTHFELPVCDILIITVHVVQSVSFLIYAFNQWLGRIMQKYEEIERNLFGEDVYCPMSASVLLTEDRQLLGILEGRQLEQSENRWPHAQLS